MRIALKHRSVHKCSGVSFVSIADYVFLAGLFSPADFPFKPSRETSATPSPETRVLYNRYGLLRSHRRNGLPERTITTNIYIGFNILRIYLPTLGQNNFCLFPVEIVKIIFHNPFGDRVTIYNMIVNNSFNHIRFYIFVSRFHTVYNNINEYVPCTKPSTANFVYRARFIKGCINIYCRQVFLNEGKNSLPTGGKPPRPWATLIPALLPL